MSPNHFSFVEKEELAEAAEAGEDTYNSEEPFPANYTSSDLTQCRAKEHAGSDRDFNIAFEGTCCVISMN